MDYPPILAVKKRYPLDESVYRGHIVICDQNGKVLSSIGDPNYVTFMRSASKPFQAMLLVKSGVYNKLSLEPQHLAVCSGSHNGQAIHIEIVSDLLSKAGLDESFLKCGTHSPLTLISKKELAGKELSPLSHNCSGKHASMLVTSKIMGWDLNSYMEISHPVQKEAKKIVSEMCNIKPELLIIGIDGCGVPVFGMPIVNMAQGFARLSSPNDSPKELIEATWLVADAMRHFPVEYAGVDRVETALLQDNPDMVTKGGAEGVYCIGKSSKGLTFKLECGEGEDVFRFLAAHYALFMGGKADKLKAFLDKPIFSTIGIQVGQIELRTSV